MLPVSSVKTKPIIILQTGRNFEEDLTHKFVDVVKTNQKLKKSKQLIQITGIHQTKHGLLNYNIRTYFNNIVSGVAVATSRNKEIKSLIEIIKGKTGGFRYNLAGKRVNYVARSVVTPETNLPVDYIEIARLFVQQLTKPVVLNSRNIQSIKQMILRYPDLMFDI